MSSTLRFDSRDNRDRSPPLLSSRDIRDDRKLSSSASSSINASSTHHLSSVSTGANASASSVSGNVNNASASVPLGPKGGGNDRGRPFPGSRTEYRDFRDAPPLSEGRSWRDRERDRDRDRDWERDRDRDREADRDRDRDRDRERIREREVLRDRDRDRDRDIDRDRDRDRDSRIRDQPPYREIDRRDRRLTPPLRRSPVRDFRDSKPYTPRDLEIPRTRKMTIDSGPLSATDTSYTETPTKGPGEYARDRDRDWDNDFSRPLGRSDWDYRGNRGRARDSYPDDRDPFRPRSRSRGPRRDDLYSRVGVGRGPDRRGVDTRGGGIGDRWIGRRAEDEKRFERDDFRDRTLDRDFERDRDRDRDRERDFDRYKRDPHHHHHPPPSRFETRNPSVGSDTKQNLSLARPSSPHHPYHPNHYPHSLYDRHVVSGDTSSKDYPTSRRSSTAQLSPQLPKTESRRDPDKSDYFASRAEASRDRYASNPSSPPVPAPQVPAFGSVQLPISHLSSQGPNGWKPARQDEKMGKAVKSLSSQQSTQALSKPSSSMPSALPVTKDHGEPQPPTAPRAERQASEHAEVSERKAQSGDPQSKENPKVPRLPPTGPSSLSSNINENASSSINRGSSSSGPMGRARPPPLGPRTSPRSPVAASVGCQAGKSQSPVSVSGAGSGGGIGSSGHDNVYNSTNVPLGPKASGFGAHKPSSSAGTSLLGAGIPTGPKAERVAPHAHHAPYSAPRGPSAGIGSGAGGMPPNAPRAAAMHTHGHGSGPRNLTWRAPSYAMRNTIIPAKRDVNGDERDREKGVHSPTRARPGSSSDSISGSQTDRQLRASSNVKSFNTSSDMANVHRTEGRPVSRQSKNANIKAEDDKDSTAMTAFADEDVSIAEAPQQNRDSKTSPEAFSASTKMEIDSEVFENEDDSDEDDDDDDDGLDLTEEDMVDNEEKFKRTIERLESTIIDLSARHLRAYSPIQNIVRLARLAQSGLPEDAYFQAQSQSQSQNQNRSQSRKKQKQLGRTGTAEHSTTPRSPKRHGVNSPDRQIVENQQHGDARTGFGKMLTPKEEELDDEGYHPFSNDRSKGLPHGQQGAAPDRPSTPDISSLPYLVKGGRPLTPLSELEAFQDREEGQERATDAITAALLRRHSAKSVKEDDLVAEFKTLYTEWRRYTMELDKERARREKAEQGRKEKSLEPRQAGAGIGAGAGAGSGPDGAAPGILGSGIGGIGVSGTGSSAQQQPTLSITEGRRAHKFSSEYELELALKESMELEQKAQAEREREEKKAKPDMDREAIIPAMLEDTEIEIRRFHDRNQYKDPADAARVYDFLPPVDDFTAEEHKVLVQNYKEFPKKWGKIAQALTNRTYKECIKHYYATKWNKEYKPPRDKRRQKGGGGGGGGRGKGAKGTAGGQARGKSNALISDLGVRPDVYEGDEINLPLVAVTDSGRPRRAAAPTFGDKEVGDVEQQQQQGPAGQGTASGNTNRKATGTAAASGAPNVSTNPMSAPGAGASRMDGPSEVMTDKQSKRQQRSAVKPTGQRRGKNQSLAATPVPSPSKQDREKVAASSKLIEAGQQPQQQQFKEDEIMRTNPSANTYNSEETKMYSTFQADQVGTVPRDRQPQQTQRTPRVPTPGEEIPMQIAAGGGLVDRPKAQVNQQQQQQRAGPSSYWSVPEQTDFINLVNYYGKDWNAIAARMGTKTATMIRNYYGRLVDPGTRPEIVEAAERATLRRERGEDMGPPPAATPSQKRRPDNMQMPTSRPPSGTASEVIEVDKSPPSRLAIAPNTSPNVKPHSRTKSQQASSFDAGLMQYQSNPSSAPLQQQIVEQQQQSRTKTSQQQVRPRLSYFPEIRSEGNINTKQQTQPVRSRQSSHSRTSSQSTQYLRHEAPQQVLQQETGPIQQHQMNQQQAQQTLPPRGDYQKHVILQQEQAKKQEARYHRQPQQHQRSNSQTIPFVQQHEQMHSGVHPHRNSYSSPKLAVHRASINTPSSSSVMPTSEKTTNHRSQVVTSQEGASTTGRQSQSNLLQLIDPAPSSTVSASSFQLSPRPPQRISSPALEPRLQAQMQGRPHTGPPPSTMPLQKPPEPRRTSNLASILNSEPEEPRPRRKQIETASAQPVAPSSTVSGTFRRRGAVVDVARSQEANVYEEAHPRDQPFPQSHSGHSYLARHQPSSHPQGDGGREAYSQPSTGHAEWSQPAGYYHHSSSQVPITPGPAPTAYGEMRSHSYQSSHSQPPPTNEPLASAQNRQSHQPAPSGSATYGHPYSSMPQGSQAHHPQQQLQPQSQIPSRMGPSPEPFARSRTPSYTQPVPLAVHNTSGPPPQAQVLQPAAYPSQGGQPPIGHRTSSGYEYRFSERERPRDREHTRPDYRDYERERERGRAVLDLQQDQHRERDRGGDREHEQYEGHHRHSIHSNHRRLQTSDAQQYPQFSGHQHPHQPLAQAQVQPQPQPRSQQRYPPEPYPAHHQSSHAPPGSASLAMSKNHSSLPPQPIPQAHPHSSQQQQQQQQQQQSFAQPYVGYMSGEGRRGGR